MGTVSNTFELGRIDYLILSTLKNNDATESIYGFTLKELEISDAKRCCLYKHMMSLQEKGYVCQSGKYKRQSMFYITELGLNVLGGASHE